MINTQMRDYKYLKITEENDDYGQPQTVEANGTIKMAINFSTETIQENSLYSNAQYVGLTLNKDIDATYIIKYGSDQLKVLYVNKQGRYTQVYLARM